MQYFNILNFLLIGTAILEQYIFAVDWEKKLIYYCILGYVMIVGAVA